MKFGAKILIVSGFVAVITVQAVTDNPSPYGRIVERNVFSLKDPPPPPPPPPPPTPKITLQGITSILGRRQVLFKFQAQGGKEQSYVLSEGERQDDVEVLTIDEIAGSVKFNNHNTVQTLTMDKDASKPPAVSVPVPGAIPKPTPTAAIPKPVANPSQPGGASVGGGSLRQIPTRNLRTPTSEDSIAAVTAAPQAVKEPELTHEEQEILVEAHKLKAKEEGDPAAAIFPPTSLSPVIEAEQSGTPAPANP